MTREEALENHRKMWNWIADETEFQKRKVYVNEYLFKDKNNPIKLLNGDYLCEYTKVNCYKCPIDWNDKEFCCKKDTSYDKWCECNTWEGAEMYAREIANLPEKIGE